MFVTLKPHGILEYSSHDEDTKDVSAISFQYLFMDVKIEEGVLLHDLITLIKPNLEIYNSLFTNCFLDHYVERGSLLERDSTFHDDKIDYISIKRYIELTKNYRNRGEDGQHLEIINSVVGHGRDPEVPAWGISFTPIKELVNLPIKIESDIEVITTVWKKDENSDKKPSWRNIKIDSLVREAYEDWQWPATFTLGELIWNIFWEISFNGTEEDTQEKFDTISNTMKEIEDGTAELIPMDDVFDKLLGDEDEDS